MSHNNTETLYRTTPARTGKMMAIMLGICIVGGAIFFSMWDYWISEAPPVVAMMQGSKDHGPAATATGETITSNLTFVESDDFRVLAFNALVGEEGSNPTINMNVGDKVVFNVDNAGISFHAFGVTADTSGVTGVIPGSEIGSMSSALKAGESGTSEFIAGEEGTFYYICTIPGHREQGMVGEIIVGPSQGGGASGAAAAAPTGVSHDFTLDFVESDDFTKLAFNALPGEDGNNPEIRVNSGDEVTITSTNLGQSFHAFGVVADPGDFNNVIMDSAIGSMSSALKASESGSVTFTAGAPGNYYYICTIPGHAIQGMQGSFIVE